MTIALKHEIAHTYQRLVNPCSLFDGRTFFVYAHEKVNMRFPSMPANTSLSLPEQHVLDEACA
ncbi:hypothetical protein, partial [Burkholderia sp. LMG 13014]|uniref:hypothetical protein n=1 Tax=Burkholderia sp. LMG 13014 TaxID=2709306 RepID=UPI0019638349